MIGSLLAIALLLVMITLGVPMVSALLGAVALAFLLGGQWSIMVPQTMISGISSFTLLSLPLFVLAGGLMNAGGISARLFEFARAMVGWMRGGLAQVDILTSMFFGGMIGSSTADLAGTASVLIPAMRKHGYPAEFASAVSASSSGIGPMLPPSSPMILYSAVTGTSLGALFVAGIIPGILMGLVFMLVVFILARRLGWAKDGTFSWQDLWVSGRKAFLAFLMPLIIVAGLVLGAFTPTEAGAFGVAYALILSVLVYRTLDLKKIYRVLAASVQTTGELLFIVSLSSAFGASLSSAGVPQALSGLIEILSFGDNTFMQLLVLMILAMIAGMFLDPLIPIFVPVVLPALLAFNIDLVHFGTLMVMAVVIGQLTPPLGIAIIIVSRIARIDQVGIYRANMPFFIAILLFTLLLMAVPALSTWLPSIMLG